MIPTCRLLLSVDDVGLTNSRDSPHHCKTAFGLKFTFSSWSPNQHLQSSIIASLSLASILSDLPHARGFQSHLETAGVTTMPKHQLKTTQPGRGAASVGLGKQGPNF